MSSQTVVSTFSTSHLSLSESSSSPVGQSSFSEAQSFSTSISSTTFRASTTSSGSISSLASSRTISSSIEALLSSTVPSSLDLSSTAAEENKSDMSASLTSSSEAAKVTSLQAGLPEDGSSSVFTSTSVEENTQTNVKSSATPSSESKSIVTSAATTKTDDGSTPKPPSAPTTSLTTPTTGKATNTQPAQPGQTTEVTNKATATTTPVNAKATTPVDAKATSSADDGLPAGASVAVVVTSVNGTAITQTTTSVPPTLASPVGVTAIDSSGHTTLTYPAIVTVLSTGTNSDGALTTETKVVINPTGETSHTIKDPDSFFSNTGAVAGTFVAVGIVVTSIAAFLYLCYRRKRRLRHQLRWLEEMHSPRPQSANDLGSFHDDPFEDRNAAPEMMQRPRTPPGLPEPSRTTYSSVPQTATAQDFRGLVAAAPSSGGAFGSVAFQNEAADPFNDIYSSSPRPIGLAVTTPSLASGHDTPSLYSKQDEDSIYEEVDIHSDEGHTNVVSPLSLPARPPRSQLRASNSVEYKTSEYKPSEYRPISPPTTVESSTPPSTPVNATPPSSSHGSPAKQVTPHSVLTRKTLLDIRPRPSRDNVLVARF